ncbi:MAG: hypothetical protein RID91_05315 [Azospirillaceae bacterium]
MTRRSVRALGGALASALVLAAAGGGTAMAQDSAVVPQPMPTGFDFPTPGYVIEQWVDAGDTAEIRNHGWMIWTAMSQSSGQTYQGQDLPVWDTWASTAEVFPSNQEVAAVAKAAGESGTRVLRPFHRPVQIAHSRALAGTADAAEDADQALSFNKFDPTAAAFIGTDQRLPDGSGTTPIDTQAGLTAFNDAWPAGTSVGARAIGDFPETGIELKPVFYLVKQDQATTVPYWQGAAASSRSHNPTPETWNTCVLIDPTAAAGTPMATATQAQIDGAAINQGFHCRFTQDYLYAPLSMMYAVPLDQAGVDAFNSQQSESGITAEVGDHAVLVAMHVNTKEQDTWTWQTFYWQGTSEFEAQSPGDLAGQPDALAAPWNSYAMCTAYSQTDAQGQMNVCFNPFLETSPGIPDGLNSNCVTCHGMAQVGPNANYPANYDDPIRFDDPSLFGGGTKTDFSWAVAGSD